MIYVEIFRRKLKFEKEIEKGGERGEKKERKEKVEKQLTKSEEDEREKSSNIWYGGSVWW